MEFEDLPHRQRSCRHELTGEFPRRECDRAFDCATCTTHARLIVDDPAETKETIVEAAGLRYPLDRMYSRGHVWVRPEPDGTLMLGADELSRRIIGTHFELALPDVGSRLDAGGPAWTIRTDGDDFRAISPVDGEVVERGAAGAPYWLRVRPANAHGCLVPLLRSGEVRPWLMRELERVQEAVSSVAGVATLADGGELVEDVAAALPAEARSAARGAVLLEP
jgi:hypothetical protein